MSASPASTDRPDRPSDMVPVGHETTERIVRCLVFGVPPAALLYAGWLAWGGTLHWRDLLVLAITYPLTGLGITVGYHRLFTHRSFKTSRPVRAILAVLGSMAVEGSAIEWAATHRKHHRFSDLPGDPHSPHAAATPNGWRGVLCESEEQPHLMICARRHFELCSKLVQRAAGKTDEIERDGRRQRKFQPGRVIG